MPKQSLTATFVQGVKSTPGKRVEYSDTKVSGLVLRVTESGAKSWSLRYRRADQSQQRYTIGAYPAVSVADARDRAIVVLSGIASGTDPTDDKKAKLQAAIAESLSTFAAIGVQYFDDAAKGRHRPNARPKRQSTLKMERDYFDRLIEPVLGRLAIGSFGRQDIQRFISDIGDKKSPTAARQCRNILRQIYSYATYLELVTTNAVKFVQIPKLQSRTRVFSDAELKMIWQATVDHAKISDLYLSESMAKAIQLTILTLQRGGEVIGIKMEELDLKAKIWTIPGERTKNHQIHVVPLSDAVVKIVEEVILLNSQNVDWEVNSGYLFPSSPISKPMTRHALTRAVKRIVDHEKIADARAQDLRRTGATNMTGEKIGESRFTVSRVLNHITDTGGSAVVTGVYDRNAYLTDKRRALNAWAILQSKIVNEPHG